MHHASSVFRGYPHFFIVEVTQSVVERAGEFAETFVLRVTTACS